jgi:VWFA-related protein
MFAIAFNETLSPALPPTAPFTSDVEVLRHALVDVVRPRGATALFDAISAGFDYADRGHHLRKVLVLVSDGGDNASTATFDEVLLRTQASNVVVYAMALVDPVDRDANPKRLDRLARASGGHLVTPTTSAGVTEALQRIASDIRHSYSIGYTRTAPADGKFHRLRVVASSATGGELTVGAREGYLAGPAPAGGDRGVK